MKLAKNVQEFLYKKSDEIALLFYQWLTSGLDDFNDKSISSPVEQLFYIEWYSRYFLAHEQEDLPFFLDPQYTVESTKKFIIDFHADFLAVLINTNRGLQFYEKAIMTINPPKLGIEIDGHIWHEKTKEQVRNDKQRERFLISSGWQLLRFTGSEVYENPKKCVDEALKVGQKLKKEYYEKLRNFKKGKK